MKKFKNFWFYAGAFCIYLILTVIFSTIAAIFLTKPVYGFLVRNFVSNSKNSSQNTIIIAFDDRTAEKYTNWDSSSTLADLLDYFYTYTKDNSIALDISNQKHNPTNEGMVKKLDFLKKMPNLTTGFTPSKDSDQNKPTFESFKNNQKLNVKIVGKDIYPKRFFGIENISEYLAAQKINLGSVYFKEDEITHQVYNSEYLVRIGEDFYPSLALKTYLLENNTNNIILDNYNIIIPKTGQKIPINVSKEGLIKTPLWFYANFEGITYSHSSISAYRILDTYYALKKGITPQNHPELYDLNSKNPLIDPENFQNKTIFIGDNITGPSADVVKTPISERHPGVDVQATAYDNLCFGDFLQKDGLLVFALDLFSFLILSILVFGIILKTRVFKGLLSIIGLNFVYFIAVIILALCGIITNPVIPISAEIITFVFGYSFKFITENRNKEKIKQAMGKYLSQDIMKNVVNNIDDLKLGGKRAIVTVLFSDIRGFTSMSEKMSAEDVTKILNEYFTEMEPIITKYNGVINKFIGDAVMAIFGEPIQDLNHPVNAVRCAYEMLQKVAYLREKWLMEGKPKIEIGIGICTGEVFIGNIGSEARMEYTVIGDTVNLASRIESFNKVYKTNLLVSSSTYSYISDVADVIKINEVKIRGKAQKMNIYEVLRIEKPNK